MNSLVAKYKLFCKNNIIIPYPASAFSVSGYVCHHVVRLNGSTKSVPSVISFIKKYGIMKGYKWLNEQELCTLHDVVKELQFIDTTPSKQKKAFTLDLIMRIIIILNLNNDEEFLVALAFMLGHNGLLRSGELFGGIQVKHITWNHVDSNLTLRLDRSKRNRSGGPEYVLIMDFEGLSAYKLLQLWFDRHELWDKQDYYLIPRVITKVRKSNSRSRKVALDFTCNGSIYWWRSWIDKCCQSIGLVSSDYSGHSLRAGGATDLFTARVPLYIVKKMGRWKSDSSCLRYYRDDIDVAEAVANAFGKALSRKVIDINKRNKRMMGV